MRRIVRGVNVLATGILAGGFVMVLTSLVPARRELPASTAVQLYQITNPRINRYVPQTAITAAASALVLLVWRRGTTSISTIFTLLGFLCSIGVGVISVFGHGPINRTIASWSPSAVPAEFPQLRERWDRLHMLRTAVGVLALICSITAGATEGRA